MDGPRQRPNEPTGFVLTEPLGYRQAAVTEPLRGGAPARGSRGQLDSVDLVKAGLVFAGAGASGAVIDEAGA